MHREPFNPSLGNVRGYAIDEKTVHRAAKFRVTFGDDRIEWVKHPRLLSVTIDERRRLSPSHHLTDVTKNFVNKLNLLRMILFLAERSPIGLVLQYKITISSIWTDHSGGGGGGGTLYILWKYFIVGQPENNIQLAPRYAC